MNKNGRFEDVFPIKMTMFDGHVNLSESFFACGFLHIFLGILIKFHLAMSGETCTTLGDSCGPSPGAP